MTGRERTRGESNRGSGVEVVRKDRNKVDTGAVSGEPAETCGTCKQEVLDEHLAQYCEYCSKWFHIICKNISEEKYELLEEDRIHWFCSKCNNKAVDVLKLANNLKESNEKLHLRVEKVKNRLDNIENMKSEPFREKIRKIIRAEVYKNIERA